jgi:hypothetical protein
MWVKQCHKLATHFPGNGKFIPPVYKNGDDWGMVYDCFTHINDTQFPMEKSHDD